MSYDALLFLQGRSPRFNLSHIAFSSAVSFGEVSCNAALARALAAMMKRSVLSTPSNPMSLKEDDGRNVGIRNERASNASEPSLATKSRLLPWDDELYAVRACYR